MDYYVYAIYNRQHNKIYIGQTVDLKKRLFEHNNKIYKGFTSIFNGNWILVHSEVYLSREQALIREKQLKSFRGREYVRKQIRE